MTGTIQPPLLAWAWRIAVGDPADGAADRRPPRLAAQQPRPRRRRAAVARAARRVGARLLAEVRPGLGPARARAARLPAAGRAATGSSAGTRGGSATRRAGALRGGDQRALVPRADRGGRALDHPGAGRPALGRAARALPRRGAAGRRAPGGRDLGRPRAAGAARPARGDRPPAGRGAPARPAALLADRSRRPRSPPQEPSFEPDRGRGLEAPLLARADLDQRRLAVWLGLRRLGYESRGRADGRAALAGSCSARACASTTTRTRARASGRATSPGRP